MLVENPEVTLEEDAHLLPEDATEHAFMDWGWMLHLLGDDEKHYWIDMGIASFNKLGTFGGMPFGKEPMDMWNLAIRTEVGRVAPIPGSIYKLADFPEVTTIGFHPYPGGSLTITPDSEKNEVVLDIAGEFHCVCNLNDHTWHATVDDKQSGIHVDLVHAGIGYPMWYGKEKMHVYVDHMRAQGYLWAGRVEGTLTIDGQKVAVKGCGARERFYCPDQSNVEAGGWCDDVWFHFDEMFGCLTEFKLSNDKDLALYLVDEKQYFMVGSFEIVHDDWAYLREIAAFIPTTYNMTIETEAGVLEIATKAVGCKCLTQGEQKQADVPNLILDWETVEGIFTYKDGRKKTLTNGFGGTNVVLWKTYPSVVLDIGGAHVQQLQAPKPTLG